MRGSRVVTAASVRVVDFLSLASMGGLDYQPLLIHSLGSPGDFAVVGDRVAWSLDAQALGFSPACPPYPPDPTVPPPDGCAPDWSTPLAGRPVDVAAVGTEQAAYGDETGRLTVVDMATGAVAWTAELGAPGQLTVAGGTIFVGTPDQVAAFPVGGCGAAGCEPAWTLPGGTTIAGGDVLYVNTGDGVEAYPVAGCGAATCAPLATLAVPGTSLHVSIVDEGRVVGATGDGRVVAFGLP